MAMNFRPVFLLGFLLSLFLSASAQTCGGQSFSNKAFGSCNDLPQLNSFLHWNYFQSNGTVSIAYRAPLSSPGWIVWGINPDGPKMVGTQAIVGVRYANGSSAAFTTRVATFQPPMQPEPLQFNVSDVSQESGSGDMTIFATLVLPNNVPTVNHVWQHGSVSGSTLNPHPMDTANKQSVGTLNFESGQGSSGGGNSKIRRRNVHGVLSAVSWGTLMPLGAIIARYMKVFKSADPAWFYLHVACQSSAYIIGVAGWGTGLKLGSDSPGITYDSHRNIGITLFVLGTLQVFALLLRPNKDHKYRLYWNIYHHSVGYTVIILSIVNIFKGLDILDPEKKWKRTYIGIIIALGAVAVILEAITWPIVIKRKWRGSEKSHHGANGVNGYGSRQNQTV